MRTGIPAFAAAQTGAEYQNARPPQVVFRAGLKKSPPSGGYPAGQEAMKLPVRKVWALPFLILPVEILLQENSRSEGREESRDGTGNPGQDTWTASGLATWFGSFAWGLGRDMVMTVPFPVSGTGLIAVMLP